MGIKTVMNVVRAGEGAEGLAASTKGYDSALVCTKHDCLVSPAGEVGKFDSAWACEEK